MPNVLFSQEGAVVTLSLNNPPLNILNFATIRELTDAVKKIDETKGCRVAVVKGEGKCFSAGADVKEHLPELATEMLRLMRGLCMALYQTKTPIVCAIHGTAYGGGFEVALLSDILIATRDCRLGFPEIRLGVFPPLAAAWRVMVPAVLGGHDIPTDVALMKGIVDEVVPAEELSARVKEWTDRLSALSGSSLKLCKSAIRGATAQGFSQRLQFTEGVYRDALMKTNDAVEGLKAFIEKRPPQWKDK